MSDATSLDDEFCLSMQTEISKSNILDHTVSRTRKQPDRYTPPPTVFVDDYTVSEHGEESDGTESDESGEGGNDDSGSDGSYNPNDDTGDSESDDDTGESDDPDNTVTGV